MGASGASPFERGLLGKLKRTADGVVGAVRRNGVVEKAVDKAKLIGDAVGAGSPVARTEPWSRDPDDPFTTAEPRLFLTPAEISRATGRKFGEGLRTTHERSCVMSYASGDVAVTLQTAPDFTGEREWMQRRAAAVGSPIDWPGVWDRGVLAVAGDDAVAIARVGPHVLEVRVAGPNAAALVDMIHRATWLPARWS